MSDNSNMVKKETLIYALLIGFGIGFITGAVFAVYKLAPSTPHEHPTQQAQPQQVDQNTGELDQQTSAAIANLEAEVTKNHDNVEAWTQLGHLYYDSSQVEKAIKAYTHSLTLHPDNPDVLTDLGVMYRRNKQPQKALESFEKAHSINPAHELSRLNKGIVLLYDLNNPEAAIAAWKDLLIVNPQVKLNNGMPLQQAIDEIRKQMQAAPGKQEE